MHKVFPRNTRVIRRIVFKTDRYEGTLYKRSTYSVGSGYGYPWILLNCQIFMHLKLDLENEHAVF